MRRIKKHRIKEENLAASSSNKRGSEEQDLAYFIHDRVELMHQVFSVLKSKELKSFAPECVRRLSTDDLQELCLEELLGISSKRLCAILDGAEPPSDTESSSQSPEHLETISLDSISSDEEILSQGSKKKKKHRHAKKKRRKKSKGSEGSEAGAGAGAGDSRAARAGLTVLELLELQARARAIRAQLHQEPARLQPEPAVEAASSDNEVEIKEEPAEVVEISSDEEKPDRDLLDQQIGKSTTNSTETAVSKTAEPQTITKKINNLVITVPQSKPTRKIRLKRQKPADNAPKETTNKVQETTINVDNNKANTAVVQSLPSTEDTSKPSAKENKAAADSVEAKKGKKIKKKKKKAKEKEGSDQDEITLQLSDSEKMDLLEDLDAKNLDNVTSSDSDSSDDERQGSKKPGEQDEIDASVKSKNAEAAVVEVAVELVDENKNETEAEEINKEIRGYVSNDNIGTVEMNDLPVIVDKVAEEAEVIEIEKEQNGEPPIVDDKQASLDEKCDEIVETPNEATKDTAVEEIVRSDNEIIKDSVVEEKAKSDGEISDRESSEVEASDVQQEIVCISDDEGKKKKKKKKDKKSKKEKKKSGFLESDDENFYKEDKANADSNIIQLTIDDDDDVYEILEISDDSSCYEVEGVSVLSKEPTAEEIEAFSAKMDEIEIDRVQTVISNEKDTAELNETCDAENVSWKDRYLGSKKVRRVLTTSNILNAIRKKNIELKKKLEEVKHAEKIEREKLNEENKPEEEVATPAVEDGSIEQYETLQGSTKYVNPVKEVEEKHEENEEKEGNTESDENLVTREMKKDAKMLLKMYKRLLKYNDVNKQKDPNKKKKKKQKKSKDKEKVKDAV